MQGIMEEFSGGSGSFLSSSSKRQRLADDACYNTNGLIPGPQLLVSHSVPMMKVSADKHHSGLLGGRTEARALNGEAGHSRNPIGPPFITSVSEECASVENLDQANDVENAESNSSTVSPSQSHFDATHA
jgi:hypothetical protein